MPPATSSVPHVDTLIITPMPIERDAFLAVLGPASVRQQPSEQSALRYHLVQVQNHKIAVVVLASMGNPGAATAAANAIAELRPRLVFVVGIAAGIKGAADFGDVLVPEMVYYHESGKQYDKYFEPRTRYETTDRSLFILAQNYDPAHKWHRRIVTPRPGAEATHAASYPQLRFGPIASGEIVVENKQLVADLKRIQPKTVGIDMESYGVACAVADAEPRPKFMVIRGVQDHGIHGKNDAWRIYAAQAAAAFAVDLITNELASVDTGLRMNDDLAASAPPLLVVRHNSLHRLSQAGVLRSLPPQWCERDMRELVIEQSDLYVTGALSDPRVAVQLQLDSAARLADLRAQSPESPIAYFGLAHVPLAFLFGHQLEKCQIEFHEKGRDSDDWWGMNDATDFPSLMQSELPHAPNSEVGSLIIRVGISYPVLPEPTCALVPDAIGQIDLQLEKPGRDKVTSRWQLNAYGRQFRTLLDELRNLYPNATCIHLFYAGPVSLAVKLGQQVNPRTNVPFVVYNFLQRHPSTYDWYLVVNHGSVTSDSVHRIEPVAGG